MQNPQKNKHLTLGKEEKLAKGMNSPRVKGINSPRVKGLKICIGSLLERCKQKEIFTQSHCPINNSPILFLPQNTRLLQRVVSYLCLQFLISNSPLRMQQLSFCLFHSTDLYLLRIFRLSYQWSFLIPVLWR